MQNNVEKVKKPVCPAIVKDEDPDLSINLFSVLPEIKSLFSYLPINWFESRNFSIKKTE